MARGPAAVEALRRVSPSARASAAVGLLAAVGALALGVPTAIAGPDTPGVSDWSASDHSAVRLLGSGPADATGALLAGAEVRLDPGYLTYWRAPGEAGLPPTFDVSKSDNVASVTVSYPAPGRFDEAGEIANGYRDDVVFPLRVVRKDPGRPATLVLDLDYAVCATLCLPGKAHVGLSLPEAAVPDAAALLAAAAARVPRPVAPDAPGPLAIERVTEAPAGGGSRLVVTARAPATADLFVEAPEGWYLQPTRGEAEGDGTVRFSVALLERPDGGDVRATAFRFTLVDTPEAIEVTTRAAPPS